MKIEEQIEEIIEKKRLIGETRYCFNGLEFKSRENAEAARNEEIEKSKKEQEKEKIRTQIEAELKIQRDKYDADPMYLSFPVKCSYIPDIQKNFFFCDCDSGLAAWVDLEDLSSKIDYACRELFIKGYEVIAITQALSGVGSYKMDKTSGAGWGYSFTNGAVITAKKKEM